MKAIYQKQESLTNHNFYFFIISIDDIKTESNRVLNVLKDRTWLSEIKDRTLIESYNKRANGTSELFEKKLKEKSEWELDDFLTFVGEKIVTINANETIEDEYGYRALPLPELWKMKKEGNPGFDYFNENEIKYYLIYGEGKFVGGATPYNNAAKQVVKFISEGHDDEELPEVKEFIDEKTKLNTKNYKEFSIAFSIPKTKGIKHEDIYNRVKSNKYVIELLKDFDIYVIGVEI